MANTITKKVTLDGERNHILQIHIVGDGTGDESATQLVDISGLSGAPTKVRIDKVFWSLTGFSATLLWDADTDVATLELSEGSDGIDFRDLGGIQDTGGANRTGDIMITTTGLGNGDSGTIILQLRKK